MATGSNTSVWDAIMVQIDKLRTANVKIGVLSAAGGNARAEGGDITIVELAAIHEYGAPAAGIPERSFIRSTFAVHQKHALGEVLTKIAKGLVAGKIAPDRAMTILGLWGVAQVKNSITNRLIKQDLKPETIARKNRTAKDKSDATTALVDTGRLLGAISYEVEQ